MTDDPDRSELVVDPGTSDPTTERAVAVSGHLGRRQWHEPSSMFLLLALALAAQGALWLRRDAQRN